MNTNWIALDILMQQLESEILPLKTGGIESKSNLTWVKPSLR